MGILKKGQKDINYCIKKILEYEGEFLYNKKYNGKGYDKNGNIIYELKNGNRNVKEYDEYDNILFEGEYLNNKRKKGKEYKIINDINKLIFEGEYLNDEKWTWNIKEYNNYNLLIYEGEYLNGKGKEYFSSILLNEGEFLNGLRNGKDKEYNIKNELIFKENIWMKKDGLEKEKIIFQMMKLNCMKTNIRITKKIFNLTNKNYLNNL